MKTKRYYKRNKGQIPTLVWDDKKKKWWNFKLIPSAATKFNIKDWLKN